MGNAFRSQICAGGVARVFRRAPATAVYHNRRVAGKHNYALPLPDIQNRDLRGEAAPAHVQHDAHCTQRDDRQTRWKHRAHPAFTAHEPRGGEQERSERYPRPEHRVRRIYHAAGQRRDCRRAREYIPHANREHTCQQPAQLRQDGACHAHGVAKAEDRRHHRICQQIGYNGVSREIPEIPGDQRSRKDCRRERHRCDSQRSMERAPYESLLSPGEHRAHRPLQRARHEQYARHRRI